MKDLKRLNRDLQDVIIIDNSPLAFHFDVNNGLPITSFIDDKSDKELFKLDFILESLSQVNDIRLFIPLFVKDQEIDFFRAKDLFLVEKRHISHTKTLSKSQTFSNKEAEQQPHSSLNLAEFEKPESPFTSNTKRDEYFQEDEVKEEKEKDDKVLESDSKISANDEKNHAKSKTISSIVVKPFPREKATTEKNKSDKQIAIVKPQSNLISSSFFPTMHDKSRSNNYKNTYNSKRLEPEGIYNHSLKCYKSSKESPLGPQPTSSTTHSKKSINEKVRLTYSYKSASIRNGSVQPQLKTEKSVSSKGDIRKLNNSFNKSNIRDNSKTSLESKYSKKSTNIKICKISRNFKNESTSVSNSKIVKTSSINSKKGSMSKEKKSTGTSSLKNYSNKILGVKVYQVNSTKLSAKASTQAKSNNSSLTPSKQKPVPRRSIEYSSTFSNLNKKSESKEKGLSFSGNDYSRIKSNMLKVSFESYKNQKKRLSYI